MSDIGLFEAIYTARSIRRLKPDPVPVELITAILDAARQAPSAGDIEGWGFVVVRDADLRQELGAIYRKASDIAAAMYAARGRPAHMSQKTYDRLMASGAHLWDHMGEAPVLIVVCCARRDMPDRELLPPAVASLWDSELSYNDRIGGASVYPAAQNILLACRAVGLGTTFTTNHIRCEEEVKTLLGIPENVFTYALMPVGWPVDKFGPLTRRPLDEVARADGWATSWPG
jgi:nitroreductase